MALWYCGALTAVLAASFISFAHAAHANANVPMASVTSVSFLDLDLDEDELGGTVAWTAPADTSDVTHYSVYLAKDALGVQESLVALYVPLGTNTVRLNENRALGSYKYVVVKTRNENGVQTNTPGSALLEDSVAVITSLSFTDEDIRAGEIGGAVSWSLLGTAPVSKYNVYLALDAFGLGKVLLSDGLIGTRDDIPANTAYGAYSFMCVYPVSSLGEASTPAAIQFDDLHVPNTPTDLQFSDQDEASNTLGGVLTWNAQADNVHYVVGYRVYLAKNSMGGGKQTPGWEVPVGSALQVTVPAGTAQGSYTHFVVYALSSLGAGGDHDTPGALSIVDLSWSVGAWSSCSAACGVVGTQTRSVCSSSTEDACDSLSSAKPDTSRNCLSYCPWTASGWGACSKACGEGQGTQTRTVECSSSLVDACDLPEAIQTCEVFCPWATGAWGACDCDTGSRARSVTCSADSNSQCESQRPDAKESCSTESCGSDEWWVIGSDEWWVIPCIIVVSVLVFCCCLLGCILLCRKKKKAPPPSEEPPNGKAVIEVKDGGVEV